MSEYGQIAREACERVGNVEPQEEVCGARYVRAKGPMPGDRIVRCGRPPHAAAGIHRENGTGVTWRNNGTRTVAAPADPPGLVAAIQAAHDVANPFVHNSHERHLVELGARAAWKSAQL